ncbi:MAG: translation initiation factor IF-3 [Alphaproteobacteria bacterium]|nr:translation initiation factor IF-3 [Alphaproteobacteria bacterium]
MMSPRSKGDDTRVNQQITAPRIRLIDANGEMAGIVPITEALRKAQLAGLDLVEIVPTAEPPVCKVMDYGKYRYEAQKKAHDARKKQKVVAVKEIKLRPTIDKHDLEIKLRNATNFLQEGDKVKFTLKFRGREMSHQEIGMSVIQRVQDSLAGKCKMELAPRMEGSHLVMIVAPGK